MYQKALISLNKAQKLNPNISEIYFTKSNIYLKISQLKNAKTALEKGLRIEPNNHNAIFQLGNILLIEKNYSEAIEVFDKSLKIKPDFWQAINNKCLAYFEKDYINLSIKLFEKAISIEENAEPLLGLAACLRITDIELSLEVHSTITGNLINKPIENFMNLDQYYRYSKDEELIAKIKEKLL